LRAPDVRLDVELAPQTVHDDLEVQFAHARNNRLSGFLIARYAEGWVFFGQALERKAQFVLILLGFRFDGDRDNRLGEGRRFEIDRVVRVAERVARPRFLQADGRHDVTRADIVRRFAVHGVHVKYAREPLVAVLVHVHDVAAGLRHARIDADVKQFIHAFGVFLHLEAKGGKLLVIVHAALDRLARVGVLAHNRLRTSGEGR
jgi:hypothetical protein